MITAAGSEPGPGGVGPGAVIRAGCADGGGGGQSKHRMGLGNSAPCARSGRLCAELLDRRLATRHGNLALYSMLEALRPQQCQRRIACERSP